MNRIRLTPTFFLVTIIIALAVAPSIALGEGNRNLFLITIMLLSPIVIISSSSFIKSDIWLWFFMLSIIFIPLLNHPESMRWSTVMYTWMFCLTYLAYNRLLYRDLFAIEDYLRLLKYLIYSYFIVLLIQQFCVLSGLPVFNVSNYDVMEPWKLNSLAAEPSHSARIVALLMYCFITIKEIVTNRKYDFSVDLEDDKLIWLAFLWTMLTMGSATAFIFIAIVLLKFIKFKTLLPLFILTGIITIIVSFMGVTSVDRSINFFLAILTLDPNIIIAVDHSASLRIVPMIILSDMIDLTTLNGWFGHGIDYVSSFLSSKISGIPKGFSGGGLLQVLIEYGFISFVLFIIFSLSSSFYKTDYLSLLFLFLLVFLNGINSQIFWLTIILLFTNKYFKKQKLHNRTSS